MSVGAVDIGDDDVVDTDDVTDVVDIVAVADVTDVVDVVVGLLTDLMLIAQNYCCYQTEHPLQVIFC